MKSSVSWLVIILLAFALGIAAAFIWFNYHSSVLPPVKENDMTDLPILAFCELVNNPDKYDGKVVRLHADIKTGNHGQYLYDSNCPADETVKNYYDATAAVMFNNLQDEEKIKQIRDARKTLNWTDPVGVIAVGKFRKNEPTKNDSGMDRNSVFRFVIISLESVSDENN